jgi:hypothetical protein
MLRIPEPAKRLARTFWHVLRKRVWLARRRSIVERYLAHSSTPKLQVGTGFNGLAGWLNGDILPRQWNYIYLDATQPLPFADTTPGIK